MAIEKEKIKDHIQPEVCTHLALHLVQKKFPNITAKQGFSNFPPLQQTSYVVEDTVIHQASGSNQMNFHEP